MAKEIPLTQGKFAIVDDEDYEYLSQFNWYANRICNTYYAVRCITLSRGVSTTLFMHHAIMGKPPKGYIVDHENHNGLDNQRHNIRFVTKRQNAQNLSNPNLTSEYPGVSWDKADKIWRASIRIKGRKTQLGRFSEEIDAANAYKKAVEEIGETLVQDL